MTESALSFDTPIGRLTARAGDAALRQLDWDGPAGHDQTPLLVETRSQIAAYFAGRLRHFDLSLAPAGTPFRQSVWRLMAAIPYGETRAYGDLAADLDTAPRAIGGACGANPIPVILPCHRVVARDGRLTGYSGGAGLDTKHFLLELERRAGR
ncbi:MAG: methylated-DNA--[protein]-cysteine S-methyltransferase [Alphaproteobacteria bacterium]|jgi:methylated-DNA-[protein]-cysteine S-methyltransferase|nr:methylated-DNA--[protein]-cysteine S-methyltransferase [Alphaproteobacteria bacterium]